MDIDPWPVLQWLIQQRDSKRSYWRSRERSLEIATLGSAWCTDEVGESDAVSILQVVQSCLSQSQEGIRAYGGLAFNPKTRSQAWMALGAGRFWIPRFEILRNKDAWQLAVNGCLDELDEIQAAWEKLVWSQEGGGGAIPAIKQVTFEPNENRWTDSVAKLRDTLGRDLGKLVMACRGRVRLDRSIDPFFLMQCLQEPDGGGYQFVVQEGETAFVGCSPECLYQRAGRQVITEAVAGTRTGQEGPPLNKSDKEVAEHDYVVRDIATALKPICTDIHYDQNKDVVSWGCLQHLRTRFEARLMEGKADGDIIQTLHPSAAVLGSPRPEAWQALAAYEKFDRGWYAGPVGWLSRDAAEFAVGLRSALVRGTDVTLYAGAGIVEGSNPAQEWQEVQAKMRPMLTALGMDKRL